MGLCPTGLFCLLAHMHSMGAGKIVAWVLLHMSGEEKRSFRFLHYMLLFSTMGIFATSGKLKKDKTAVE